MNFKVIQGDCLVEMQRLIDEGVKVDCVLTDPPYGTTACSWDSVIPFAPMWKALKALTHKNSPIVLFGSQPFTSALVMSNPKMFKYEIIWQKTRPHGFFNVDYRPMSSHENILIFSQAASTYSKKVVMTFNPQKTEGKSYVDIRQKPRKSNHKYHSNTKPQSTFNNGFRYPQTVIDFDNSNFESPHETQKPVSLMRYLIRTYSNEGETILDFTCGSGSTGVACAIENRNFIGIEIDEHFCSVANSRITRATGKYAEIPKKVTDKDYPLFEGAL